MGGGLLVSVGFHQKKVISKPYVGQPGVLGPLKVNLDPSFFGRFSVFQPMNAPKPSVVNQDRECIQVHCVDSIAFGLERRSLSDTSRFLACTQRAPTSLPLSVSNIAFEGTESSSEVLGWFQGEVLQS